MKKKQFMSKLAALTMAAAMGLTAVPATTVFAQTVAVDESNITINGTTTISSYTVDGEASSDLASTDVRKTIGDKINGANLTSADTTDEAKATEAIDEVRPDNVNVADSYTFDIRVVDAQGNELQPAEDQKVDVTFSMARAADPNLSADIYHMTEKEAIDEETGGEKKEN